MMKKEGHERDEEDRSAEIPKKSKIVTYQESSKEKPLIYVGNGQVAAVPRKISKLSLRRLRADDGTQLSNGSGDDIRVAGL